MRHRVLFDSPHHSSHAAKVLLAAMLRRTELQQWLDFRAVVLAEERLAKGDLVCHYCGRKGLVEEVADPKDKVQLRQLATLDHIHPVAEGGARYDRRNLVVACYPCNMKKRNSMALAGEGVAEE